MAKCSCGKYGVGAWQPGWCRPCWLADAKGYRGDSHPSKERHSASKVWSIGDGYVPPSSRKGSCVHRLEVIERTDWLGSQCDCPQKWKYKCRVHGQATPSGDAHDGSTSCGECPQWAPHDVGRVGDVPAMVSIGSYGLPGMVELQLRLIRSHCGDIPILVSDDHSPEGQIELIRESCERHGATLALSQPDERIGHAGGDLGAFYHALTFARERGIRYVFKLSQRYAIDKRRWVQDTANWMDELGKLVGTASDRCSEGGTRFDLRSEAVGIRVEKWLPHLEAIKPRRLHQAAEPVVTAVAKSAGDIVVWPLLGGPDRLRKAPNVVWHTANTESDYRALAERFGVDLDMGRKFFTAGWNSQHDLNWG